MSTRETLIRKGDGRIVPFDGNKVVQSIMRTGVDADTAHNVLEAVEKQLKPKMTTSKIYEIVRQELNAKKPWAASRYDLRDGIRALGPAGYNFEKYVAAVLSAYGYKTLTPDTYQGACVKHEIDVTAEKDGRTAFIEAKFRTDFRSAIVIKDTLATWARFLDLVDGSNVGLCPHFDEVWIVTNARFTDQSLEFGHCKNIKLLGWNHPHERTFAQMVDLDALYPVTVMHDLSKEELKSFAAADIMLCRDIGDRSVEELANQTGLNHDRLEAIHQECALIVKGADA